MAIHELENNPDLKGQVRLIDNVSYAAIDGRPLKMAILEPWTQRFQLKYNPLPRPLIVFVQGSSWRVGKMGEQIPQLIQFVKAGYVVATVQHRNTLDGYPFPAFLQDVKTAIRYLRRHAIKYAIDPEKVAIWGTSSGANAAMLVALTGDDPRYAGHLYLTESDRVNAVVSCFAPMDIKDTFEYTAAVPGSELLKFCLLGMDTKKWPEKEKEMSPLYQVKPGQDYPPFLLLHGDADKVVPYHQMEDMYHKLTDEDYDVEAYRVKGANHEKDFWSAKVYQVVQEFLDQQLKN
ncbi:alpha/beta hydrolase [Limosilactobacillus avium]|uniref:alpha/beta hydrolase n=1 Tax=Limosilactobacillus avium TaxID=2991831 RepID=UPI0024BB94DB|nr:alpha/beta hydrolase [Limosilactobacillus avium]